MVLDPGNVGAGILPVQGGFGEQQFAVPVTDPTTGQQTYMLVYQSQLEQQNFQQMGGEQFMVVNKDGADVVQANHQQDAVVMLGGGGSQEVEKETNNPPQIISRIRH